MIEMVEPNLQAGLEDTVAHVNDRRNNKILLRQQKQAMLGGAQTGKGGQSSCRQSCCWLPCILL